MLLRCVNHGLVLFRCVHGLVLLRCVNHGLVLLRCVNHGLVLFRCVHGHVLKRLCNDVHVLPQLCKHIHVLCNQVLLDSVSGKSLAELRFTVENGRTIAVYPATVRLWRGTQRGARGLAFGLLWRGTHRGARGLALGLRGRQAPVNCIRRSLHRLAELEQVITWTAPLGRVMRMRIPPLPE